MPRDMAMQRPDAWVIEIELDDEVAIGTDELGVAALGVRGVDDGAAIPGTFAFGQNLHVVAVHVHGVRGGEADGGHDYADGGVGAEVEDLALGWELGLAEFAFEAVGLISLRVERNGAREVADRWD